MPLTAEESKKLLSIVEDATNRWREFIGIVAEDVPIEAPFWQKVGLMEDCPMYRCALGLEAVEKAIKGVSSTRSAI